MRAVVVVHVRERPDGVAAVTPVEFAHLAVAADSLDAALAELREDLRDELSVLGPASRLSHLEAPDAEIHRVPITVTPRTKGDEPVDITAGIVIVTRASRSGPHRIAYAPVHPQLHASGRGESAKKLAARAAERLANRLSGWSTAAILAADEPDDSRLETLVVDAPEHVESERPSGILQEYGVDLTTRDAGGIDRREELVRRVLETLAAEERSSVLLVGRPDVGKSALVHEVARRLAAGDVPQALAGRRLWRLSANELIAGARYTGMWQDRVRRFIEQARAERAIIAMGDPVGIIDAGKTSSSDNNFSRFLRPFVDSGEITLVCECTPEQLRSAHDAEPSFVDAFHRVDLPEPGAEEALQIADVAAARLASAAGIEIDGSAAKAAVELTGRFEPYRSFPGKAVRLLEDAVRERPEQATQLDGESVTATFSKRTGLPLAFLTDTIALRIDEVRERFANRVLGQPDAVEAVVDVVSILKAGLNDPGKPLASLFFVGPTGVGKTELAKGLAEYLFGSADRMVRLDMGEFAAPDAVRRLIGSSWSREGELTRALRAQPFSVVLLDEVEKAHWSVFDALLGALGEGRLTDAAGRTAYLRNAIVILTSNLGASRAQSPSLGFATGEAGAPAERYVEEAERFFRPEFFNRLDRIVVFHALTADTVRRIARRELHQLLHREGIVRRGLRVEVDDAVVDQVAAAGFHPRYGARPLQRAIEQSVIGPLAQALLAKPPKADELVRIHLRKGAVGVSIEPLDERPRSVKRSERRASADDASFAKAKRNAEAFLGELEADDATGFVAQVEPEISGLIAESHRPGFWDDPEHARSVLQRVYRLEQAVNAFASIEVRAQGLAELARRVHENRDRARVKEVALALEEMRGQLGLIRLELAAAAAGAVDETAVVRVVPVGGDALPWGERLLGMYERWAERTGRSVARAGNGRLEVSIAGLASGALLAGESGLHRRVGLEGAEQLARVIVSAGGETPDDANTIVRVYDEGKRRAVRDPRTGARSSRVEAVLDEGALDPFLIAWRRRR